MRASKVASSSCDDNRSKSRSGKRRKEESSGLLWVWVVVIVFLIVILGVVLKSCLSSRSVRQVRRDSMLMLEEGFGDDGDAEIPASRRDTQQTIGTQCEGRAPSAHPFVPFARRRSDQKPVKQP